MLISTMIEKLQRILKEHGDYPVSMRVNYDDKRLSMYLWDEESVVTMRIDGRLHINYESPK